MTKHAGDAHVTATFERLDGAVALRLRWPTGVAPGETHAEALAWGLTCVRWEEANARWLRTRYADAACTCGVGEGAGHRWGCLRVWCEQGIDGAREAPRETTR